MAMFLDYKPMRYEGKGFLRNLNLRIHRDITGDRGQKWGRIFLNSVYFMVLSHQIKWVLVCKGLVFCFQNYKCDKGKCCNNTPSKQSSF